MDRKLVLCFVFYVLALDEVRCLQESNSFDHTNSLQQTGERPGFSAMSTSADVDAENDDDFPDRVFEGSGRGEVAVRAAYPADEERYETDNANPSEIMNIDAIATHTPDKPGVVTYDVTKYVSNAVSKVALMFVRFVSSPAAVHSFFNDPVDLRGLPINARTDMRFVELFVRSVSAENFICLQKFACQFPFQANRYIFALRSMLTVVEKTETRESVEQFRDIVATIEAAARYGRTRNFKLCEMKFPCKCNGQTC